MAITVIKNYGRRTVTVGKSKRGLIIGISLLVATGIGLLVWHLHTKKKEKLAKAGGVAGDTAPASAGPNTSPDATNPSTSSPSVSTNVSSSTNPVSVQSSAPKDALAFQKWCNKNKGTTLTEDGIFGPKSKAAWTSFGLEYQKIENMKMQPFSDFKGNPIGAVVHSKFVGSDIFDGTVADGVFKKIATTTKVMPMGRVAKVVPTSQGSFVVFSGAPGKFYKMHSSHLNIFA